MPNSVQIGNGFMPLIGLGTWTATDDVIEKAVDVALNIGYRQIDTAFNYNNEEAIGRALKKWFDAGGNREDLFVTTKLPHVGMRAEDVPKFLNLSLKRLQLNYVDLYLIHLPFGFVCNLATMNPAVNEQGNIILDTNTNHLAIWQALEQQVGNGLIRNLGISNFNPSQIQNVYNNATKVKPSVLQVELHAYLQQTELRKLCSDLNMAVTAYSPLGSPGAQQHFMSKYQYSLGQHPDILGHPVVNDIATKHNKTHAQILLRHLVQNGIIVIPKSGNPERIKENFQIFDFELTGDEMNKLNGLDQGDNGRIFNFLFWRGVQNHPEYPFPQYRDVANAQQNQKVDAQQQNQKGLVQNQQKGGGGGGIGKSLVAAAAGGAVGAAAMAAIQSSRDKEGYEADSAGRNDESKDTEGAEGVNVGGDAGGDVGGDEGGDVGGDD